MNLAENIVKALGIDAQQLREIMSRVVGTAQRVDGNLIGAQTAVRQAREHFDARLNHIERHLSLPPYGASQHDRPTAPAVPGSDATLAGAGPSDFAGAVRNADPAATDFARAAGTLRDDGGNPDAFRANGA